MTKLKTIHTFVFFDDSYPQIYHTTKEFFCFLPEWENRIKEIKEFQSDF